MAMTKRFFALLTLWAFIVVCTNAHLVVIQTDGSSKTFTLQDISRITFSNGQMIVLNTDGTNSTESVTRIHKLFFGNVELSGIQTNSLSAPLIKISGNTLYIESTPEQYVSLYSSNGKIIAKKKADKTGKATMSMSRASKGIYILRVGDKSIKIKKQ